MNKTRDLLSKTLVVGVIVLFLGISVQPAFANNDDTTPPVTVHTLDPPEPDGNNGWYVSDVNVTLTATDDMSGVKEIRYTINGWSEHIIPGDNGSFIILGAGEDILIEYWAIDNAGNVETKNDLELDIDKSVPEVSLSFSYSGNRWLGWKYNFTATATDDISGMDRVEFYFNNDLQEIVTGPGPIYIWTLSYCIKPGIYRATAYDKAGLCESDEIQDPKTTSNNYLKNIQQNNKNINFLKISFNNLEVFLRTMKLSR